MQALSKSDIKMPLFFNHGSARIWFKNHYGKLFAMVDTKEDDGVKYYIYHIVHDKLTYLKSMNAIREGNKIIQHDFHMSYTELEISEDGIIFFNERGVIHERSEQRNGIRLYNESYD